MFEKCLIAFDQAEESVSAERLHQPLDSAEPEGFTKIRRNLMTGRGPFGFVILKQFFAFGAGEADVRIEEKRREVVFRQARSHPLEIDQVSLAVANDDVLRLKISMNQNP